MRDEVKNFWLAPLIETEEYKNVLFVSNKYKNQIKEISDTVFNMDGNLIILSDKTNEKVNNNNQIMYFDKDVRKIFPYLQLKRIRLDVLLIDEFMNDFYDLLSKMDKNGLIIVNKKIKNSAIKKVTQICEKRFETENYIFFVTVNNDKNDIYYKEIEKRLLSIEKKINTKEIKKTPIIGVGVLTYNHEEYIIDCLNGIYKQVGNFKIELTIIDDCSPDNTAKYIDEFLKNNKNRQIKVKYIKNQQNVGMIQNMKTLIKNFSGTDYFTFCEGDDCWISSLRIDKFIQFMNNHRSVSVAFNGFYLYDQLQCLQKNIIHAYENKNFYNTRNLIGTRNFIGNFSCCFYDSDYLDKIADSLYDSTLYDFLFNTIYSMYGFIGYLHDFLSIYRFHSGSLWSSMKENQKILDMYQYVNDYNLVTGFVYDNEYRMYHNELMNHNLPANFIDIDIIILDNFCLEETLDCDYFDITPYLEYYKSVMYIISEKQSDFSQKNNLRNIIQEYKIKNPKLHNKITDYNENKMRVYNPKLIFLTSFSLTKIFFNYILEKKKPFVVKITDVNDFIFDDLECDYVLKHISKLKHFEKLIVTKSTIKDYILRKKLCKKNQIELIPEIDIPYKNNNCNDQNKEYIEIFNKILGRNDVNEKSKN